MRDLEKLDPIIMTVHETSGRRLNDRRTPALHIWKRAIHNRTMTNNQQYVVTRKKIVTAFSALRNTLKRMSENINYQTKAYGRDTIILEISNTNGSGKYSVCQCHALVEMAVRRVRKKQTKTKRDRTTAARTIRRRSRNRRQMSRPSQLCQLLPGTCSTYTPK